MTELIPKIFHKVWFDMGNGKVPPSKYDLMKESLEKFHPEWKIMEWDEEKSNQLIYKHYNWFWDTWKFYKETIYKVDAIRYFVLHFYGGVYIDQDIEIFRPLDDMIIGPNKENPRTTILVESNQLVKSISNFVMSGTKNNDFFKHCINRLINAAQLWNSENSFLSTMNVAGPHFLMFCFKSFKNRKQITVLCSHSFTGGKLKENKIFDYKYGMHEFHSSWGSKKKAIGDVKKIIFIIIFFLLFILIILFITKSFKKKNNKKVTFVDSNE